MLKKNHFSLKKGFVILAICFVSFVQGQENKSFGKWQTLTTENEAVARHECSFVTIGTKLYLVGGRGIKPISIFDLKTKKWSEGTAPPIEIHHFQGVTYKGKIYVIGAMTGKYPYEKPLKNVLVYDPTTDKWEEGAEIPAARLRGSAGVVVDGIKAFVISGIVDGHNSGHVTWVDQYDFEIGKWIILADTPRARDHFHAALKNGKIYAAGGRNSSFATKQTFELTIPEVDVYDIKTNKWSTFAPENNIPTMRAGASTVFLGNDLILIGGESVTQDDAYREVDAFNIKSESWRKLATLNVGRHGTQAVVYDNKVMISAGSGKRGGKPELSSIEEFEF